MYRLLVLILLLFLLVSPGFGQYSLSGRVLSRDTKKPLNGCSVFLSNTSRGTITDSAGYFLLEVLPEGQFDLIISHISHETFRQSIRFPYKVAPLSVELSVKTGILQEVIVGEYEKGDWKTWGDTFKKQFIGQSDAAKACYIRNTDVIRFLYHKKKKELIAFADEPLLIENKSLGYAIRYQLEDFVFNTYNSHLYFTGFPYFSELKAGKAKLRHWIKFRTQIYKGSMMHFLRSLYKNKLAENQFLVRRLEMITESAGPDAPFSFSRTESKLSETIQTGDSIAYAQDSVTLLLDFTDHLQVTYAGGRLPPDYKPQGMLIGRKPDGLQVSALTLTAGTPVQVFHYGSYAPAKNLSISGYWAWREKIAMLLPFDYKP